MTVSLVSVPVFIVIFRNAFYVGYDCLHSFYLSHLEFPLTGNGKAKKIK